jgi:hypothetical protein
MELAQNTMMCIELIRSLEVSTYGIWYSKLYLLSCSGVDMHFECSMFGNYLNCRRCFFGLKGVAVNVSCICFELIFTLQLPDGN